VLPSRNAVTLRRRRRLRRTSTGWSGSVALRSIHVTVDGRPDIGPTTHG